MTSVSSATNKVYEGAPKLELKPLQPEKLAATLEMVVTQAAVVEKDTSNISRAATTQAAAATYAPRRALASKKTEETQQAEPSAEAETESVFTARPNKPMSVAANEAPLNAKSFTTIRTPEPRPSKQMLA